MKRVAVAVVVGLVVVACSPADTSTDDVSISTCVKMTQEDIDWLVVNNDEDGTTYMGSQNFTVVEAWIAPTTNETFDNVHWLVVDSPDDSFDNAVFTFAAGETGFIFGADQFTRDWWAWGPAADPGSPAAGAAADAVDNAPICVS